MVAYSVEVLQQEYEKYINENNYIKGRLLEYNYKVDNVIYLRKRFL